MAILRFHVALLLDVMCIPIRLLTLLALFGASIYYHIKGLLTFRESWSCIYEGFNEGLLLTVNWIMTGKLNIKEDEESEETALCE